MKSQMVIVSGPESSGTRLTKTILMMNGYVGGADHEELWGNLPGQYNVPPAKEGEHRVWRHSCPMAEVWPRLYMAADLAKKAGHEVLFLVTTRAMWPCLQSAKRKHQGTVREIGYGYYRIWHAIELSHCPFWIISYEELMMRGIVAFRGAPLALPIREAPIIRNENMKWYVEK